MAQVTSATRARVQIDLNTRTPDGYVRARIAHATRRVHVGESVSAYEPEEGVVADAFVVAVDDEHGFVFLDVDWDTLDDKPGHVTTRTTSEPARGTP